MTNLMSKLPFDLRRRWVTKSVNIERKTGSIAKFADFVSFVQNESAIANSLFGKRSLSIQSSITSSKPKPKVKASSFHATATSTKSNLNKTNIKSSKILCWYCNESSHWLLKCKSFQSIPVKERLSFVKQRKLCHKCLSSKHRTPECKRSKTLLHRPTNVSEGKPNTKDTETTMSEVISEVPVTCGLAKSNTFKHSKNSHEGSTHSFCGKSLIKKLGIIGTHENLNLKTITGTTTNLESILCDLVVSDLGERCVYNLSNVLSVDNIPVQPNDNSVMSEVLNLPHLKDVTLNTLPDASVNLLIGANAPEVFCIYSARKGTKVTPCAIETPFGWSLLGPSFSPSKESNRTVNFVDCKRNHEVAELVEKMWENEFDTGTSIFDGSSSKEDRIAYAIMQSSICESDGHYQLPLLWKEGYLHQLPNNLFLAQRRLVSLKRRLLKDKELKLKYVEVVN